MRRRDFSDRRQIAEMRFPPTLGNFAAVPPFVGAQVCAPHAPEVPPVAAGTRLVTIGSCFAGNVAAYLAGRGYDVLHYEFSERLFTTFAMKDFFAALGTGAMPDALIDDVPENARRIDAIHAALAGGCTVIMTLGLSMCWFDKETGAMIYDPTEKGGVLDLDSGEVATEGTRRSRMGFKERLVRYEMRHTGVEDNRRNLEDVLAVIRALNPANRVVLTLSPVPLQWCQADEAIVTADCLSKSVLRLAIEEVMRRGAEGVDYFPSFEIVRWAVPHANFPVWGLEDGDPRHVSQEVIKLVMGAFEHFYVAR